jgi:hypothetical protein
MYNWRLWLIGLVFGVAAESLAVGDIVGFSEVLNNLQPVTVAGDPSGVPADSPANRVDANTTVSRFAGVGSITVAGGVIGTGTPISPTHILTAAHLVSDGNGMINVAPGNVIINLNYGGNLTHSISASALAVHPDFTGFENPAVNDDLAIITLSMPLPAGVPIYPLFATPVTAGTTLTFVGYGDSGDGVNGITVSRDASIKRVGKNNADELGADDEGSGKNELFVFDFDGPTASTNFLGGTTLGNDQETTFLGGDSGGPAFFDDGSTLWLAGVNTFIGNFTGGPDAPLFGSAGGGMLVHAYLDDFILPITAIPEANALLSICVAGLSSLLMAWIRRAARGGKFATRQGASIARR